MQKLALLGGEPVKGTSFPDWPVYDESERQALMEVLDSRVWWRTPGTRSLQFESEFAAFCGAKHGVGVANGTEALFLALKAVGIGEAKIVVEVRLQRPLQPGPHRADVVPDGRGGSHPHRVY